MLMRHLDTELASRATPSQLFVGRGTITYLKPAKGVFLCELHWSDVIVEVAFACSPEGLKLVPFCQNSISLIS